MGWLSRSRRVEVVRNFHGRRLAKIGRSKMWMCVVALTPLSERAPPGSEKRRLGLELRAPEHAPTTAVPFYME